MMSCVGCGVGGLFVGCTVWLFIWFGWLGGGFVGFWVCEWVWVCWLVFALVSCCLSLLVDV